MYYSIVYYIIILLQDLATLEEYAEDGREQDESRDDKHLGEVRLSRLSCEPLAIEDYVGCIVFIARGKHMS